MEFFSPVLNIWYRLFQYNIDLLVDSSQCLRIMLLLILCNLRFLFTFSRCVSHSPMFTGYNAQRRSSNNVYMLTTWQQAERIQICRSQKYKRFLFTPTRINSVYWKTNAVISSQSMPCLYEVRILFVHCPLCTNTPSHVQPPKLAR